MDISEVKTKSAPIFKAYGVKRASVFGSTARGDARTDSDVDFLVVPGYAMGLVAYSRFVGDLAHSLGRRVDVITENSLHPRLRTRITPDLKLIYEEG